MIRTLQIVLALAMSLWLGGLCAVIFFVSVLFKTDRSIATAAAPVLFESFAKVQIVLAGIALLAALGTAVVNRSVWSWPLVAAIVAGGFASAIIAFWIIPDMEALRAAGESGSPRFRKLHQLSTIFFTCEGIVLLIGTALLPVIFDRGDQTARKPVPAATFQA